MEHSRERFSPTLYSALGYAAHSFHHSLEEIKMKVRKLKQHHLALMKHHEFRRKCARYIAASRLRRAQQLATELVELPVEVEGLFVLEPCNF